MLSRPPRPAPPASNATITACTLEQPLDAGVASLYLEDALKEYPGCATVPADAMLAAGCSFATLAEELASPTCRKECGVFVNGAARRGAVMGGWMVCTWPQLPAHHHACCCCSHLPLPSPAPPWPPGWRRQPWATSALCSL